MNCSTCNATNDATNVFCEQCGARLQQQPAAVMTAAPTAAPLCPTCGSPVLPGEAFCDECGAPLAAPEPVALASQAQDASANGVSVASVDAGPAPAPAPLPPIELPPMEEPPVELPPVDLPPMEEPPIELPPVELPPMEEPPIELPPLGDPPIELPPLGDPPIELPLNTDVPAFDDATVVADATTTPGLTQAAYDAEHARLSAAVAEQQEIVSQLAPIAASLGTRTPAGVAQSLDAARTALADAEAAVTALPPPQPSIDPAERTRLETIVADQTEIIAQLEPIAASLGARTPAGVAQSLDAARTALVDAQAALLAAGIGAPAAPMAAPAVPPVAAADDFDSAQAPTIFQEPVTENQPPAAVPLPPPVGPKLRFDDGREIVLPIDLTELIVGREDPISGIHPEIDLTPFGGENGGVSRQHARINIASGAWTLTDLNSTNYTRIDGVKLDPAVPKPLASGAKLQFGRLSAIFTMSA